MKYMGVEKSDCEAFEFTHLHIQIREDDFILKVLGKKPLMIKSEEEILATLKWWAKEVRKTNWGKKRR